MHLSNNPLESPSGALVCIINAALLLCFVVPGIEPGTSGSVARNSDH
jgi:hypothetical protein